MISEKNSAARIVVGRAGHGLGNLLSQSARMACGWENRNLTTCSVFLNLVIPRSGS